MASSSQQDAPGQRQDRPRPPALGADLPAEFWMYSFKVVPCDRRHPHDWQKCLYAHPGEIAKRRHPSMHQALLCPDVAQQTPKATKGPPGATCPRGDTCPCAHSTFEFWLHPDRFRTSMCEHGKDCKRRVCFFAHSPEELRKVNADSAGGASDLGSLQDVGTAAPAQLQQLLMRAGSGGGAGAAGVMLRDGVMVALQEGDRPGQHQQLASSSSWGSTEQHPAGPAMQSSFFNLGAPSQLPAVQGTGAAQQQLQQVLDSQSAFHAGGSSAAADAQGAFGTDTQALLHQLSLNEDLANWQPVMDQLGAQLQQQHLGAQLQQHQQQAQQQQQARQQQLQAQQAQLQQLQQQQQLVHAQAQAQGPLGGGGIRPALGELDPALSASWSERISSISSSMGGSFLSNSTASAHSAPALMRPAMAAPPLVGSNASSPQGTPTQGGLEWTLQTGSQLALSPAAAATTMAMQPQMAALRSQLQAQGQALQAGQALQLPGQPWRYAGQPQQAAQQQQQKEQEQQQLQAQQKQQAQQLQQTQHQQLPPQQQQQQQQLAQQQPAPQAPAQQAAAAAGGGGVTSTSEPSVRGLVASILALDPATRQQVLEALLAQQLSEHGQ